MSSCRGSDTAPERAVRAYLHARGFRFVLGGRDLPGRPDIVLPRHETAIFVHGCFWHGHIPCAHYLPPMENRAYWGPKIRGNRLRDRRQARLDRALGWRVIVVWECEIEDERVLRARLRPLLELAASEGPGEAVLEPAIKARLAILAFRARSAFSQGKRLLARARREAAISVDRRRGAGAAGTPSRVIVQFVDPRTELASGSDTARFKPPWEGKVSLS